LISSARFASEIGGVALIFQATSNAIPAAEEPAWV
jgi:hypothetical protein